MVKDIKMQFSKRTVIVIILILIILLSKFVVSTMVTDPSFNEETIKSLDDKKVTVLKLAAASAASSTALSLIPGDAATPIANQMASLTSYFIIVLSAILLEKMLISVVGYVAFSYIIPIACILGIIYLFTRVDVLKNIAIKLAVFGLIIFIAIPVSIKVSDLIYDSHEATINQTVETAEDNTDYIEDKKGELSEEDKDWMSKIGGYLSNFSSKIGDGVSDIMKKGEETLNRFLDTIAVLIITTCVIPLIVILIFVWVTKIFFSFDLRLPKKMSLDNPKSIESEKKSEVF